MLWSILPLDLKMMVYDHIAPDDKRAFRYVDKITYQTFRHRVNLAAPKTRDAVTTLLRFDHYSHFGTEATLGDALLRRATHTGITLPCDARAESSGSSEGQRGAQRVLAAMPSYTQLMLTIPRFPSLVQELVDGATGTDLDIAAARWIAGRAELGFTTPFYVNLPPALERSALGSWIATTLGGEVWRTVSREKQEECPESSLAASQSHASNVRAQDPVVWWVQVVFTWERHMSTEILRLCSLSQHCENALLSAGLLLSFPVRVAARLIDLNYGKAARQRFVRQITAAFSDIVDSLIDPKRHEGSGKSFRGLFENFFARSGFPTGMVLSEQEGWQRMKRTVQDGLADLT